MVGWKFIETVGCFGFGIEVGVGPSDEPEHRRDMPFGSEQSEVLARASWLGFHDAVLWKVLAECGTNTFGCLRVIGHERIAVQRCERRVFGCSRSRRLSLDNPPDGGEYARTDALVERPHVQFK